MCVCECVSVCGGDGWEIKMRGPLCGYTQQTVRLHLGDNSKPPQVLSIKILPPLKDQLVCFEVTFCFHLNI